MARTIEGRHMDGVREGYVPEEPLDIHPSLPLWDEPVADVDPVTFEVIRHSLWHVNEEHGETIVKVSGSPIAVFGQDFNACIMDERGDYLFFGPYLQLHSGMQDLSVKWILEHRSANPGIRDGDMWLHNDPWVGTTHQSDAATMCPVFVDGKLFCWVGNTLHFVDVGGPTPGGWCPDAQTVWDEPPTSPPMKVVEDGALRADIEAEWVRRSRIPELVALDLRAVVAGNNVARDRVLALVRRYGAATVKAVMRKIVDDAERRFQAKLERIPDGRWQARTYLEVAGPGDRGSYPCVLTLRKDGDTVAFSNAGTHPATGSLNLTYAGWRGAILATVGPLLCYDSLFAVGGAVRHCRFDPTPGCLLSASHPASVSNGGAIGALATIALANVCLAGMMGCDRELLGELTAPTGLSQWPVTALYGRDQRGRDFSTVVLDWYLGTMGAQAWRDGVHTGGVYWGPYHLAPNVEQLEQGSPVLYLHRGELRDGQGLGRYCSGAGPTAAWTPHRTDRIVVNISTCGMAVPTAAGIFGGHPGIPNALRVRRAGGEAEDLRPKEKDLVLEPGDVYEGWSSGGAGYGDPLLRDPELVAADVRDGHASRDAAGRFLGVRLDDDGAVLADETASLRARLRAERLGCPPTRGLDHDAVSDAVLHVGDALAVVETNGEHRFVCAHCGEALGPADGDFKAHAVRRDRPLAEAGVRFGDPARFVDRAFELRLFLCGGCGTLLDTEVAAADDPPVHSLSLQLSARAHPVGAPEARA
ncbi:MAG: hydantoinase B/oxoprolinase family protein [Solirubrobacteraceae bacterium]